ncbi:MAG TPA: hypothetical protein PKO34_02200, partial [Smithellaceae bacterium]|nr:hypothetical protein [Smithellaceae bacterium]
EKEGARQVVQTFVEYLQTNTAQAAEIYPAALKFVKEKTGAKGKGLFMPLRAALTGRVHGPELDRLFAVLGKEAALNRLQQFIGEN